ncbi:Cyclic di-GMP phosphodiesterase response regulator RpfG [Halomonas sp. THAF5a]|uniref:HD-GYP domain-containing protein n=1 Tax=Halomonas sp. THAF5a TaxID=2587844 RepID=UPI001267ECDA|nr:HD-GYP domain-containing protein [Halomonas sp. THAF5a]QFU02955.1 Cyclic di-GMP phosphodiesterase response regulator RpfG [Halomonas sp. THAF5a]
MLNEHIPIYRNLIQIPTSALRIGMYVAQLDRPWLETPFTLEGLLIRNQNDIKKIKKYASTVYISVDESSTNIVHSSASLPYTKKRVDTKTNKGLPYEPSSNPIPIRKEIQEIGKEHADAKGMIKNLMSDSQNWHNNLPRAKEVVKSFAQSIIRNQNALYWLTRIKNKNEYTAEHCLNVGILAMLFAKHLGWEMKNIEEVGLAGMLHDVGKMSIPAEILDKPERLSDAEFDIIKNHVLEGYKILSRDKTLPETVLRTSRDHHERINGAGYPYGKKGDDISDEAKLIAIVDTYDAITSERVYSPAQPPTEALRIIYEESGELFDKFLAVKFIECIGIYPPGSAVQLDTGETAIVVEQNPKRKLLPKVFILPSSGKQHLCNGTLLDLSQQKHHGNRKINRALSEPQNPDDIEEIFNFLKADECQT